MISRRQALRTAACGFGQLALAGQCSARMESGIPDLAAGAHFRPRAKRMIFLFMQGGPSQVDTFDYKPRLALEDGKQFPFDDARTIANTGLRGSSQRVMKSPWKFKQYGQSGRWVSSLFPHMAAQVDDLCFVHSMQTEGVAHGPATLFLHCGATRDDRPSMGSWISYGLGSENQNLPAFVSIAPSEGNGGARNYGNSFLPARYQGTALGNAGAPASAATINNIVNTRLTHAQQRAQFEFLQNLNREQIKKHAEDMELDAVIRSYELAWKMQSEAPGVIDMANESAATLAQYGIGEKATDDFGKKCLLARRMSEAGVRFVQVTYGDNSANPAWDQHNHIEKHADHAGAVDRPIAGLLQDLKQRGLLDETLVWWGGEFGRTPYAQGKGNGRDHNPQGFTVCLAGGGIRSGFAYGETDEFGHVAIRDKIHLHDLHATLLYLLGIDHERLTFQHAGRDFRLTDVHGRIVKGLLA
jgi:hypothetical protein